MFSLETETKYEEKFAIQIEVQEKQLAPFLQQVFLARTLDEKKQRARDLSVRVRSSIKSDFKNTGEFVFYSIANKFFTPGWFLSENDQNNLEAGIYLYSLFPQEFIDYAFDKFSTQGFREEVLHYYGRTLVRISKANAENRNRTLEKMKVVLSKEDATAAIIQAKIFSCMDAIALDATELLGLLEELKSGEKNTSVKKLYADTISLINEKSAKN